MALLPVILCVAGCVNTGSFLHPPSSPFGAEPCRVVATWNPSVVFTPDPVHDGKPIPGLAGRIYLFGPEIGCPMLGNGALAVQLFDVTKPCGDADPKPLEEWRFTGDILKQLQKRDAVGWGYTLFLPWGTFRPEITQVRLKVCYQPPKGFPIYAASAPMTLADQEQLRTLVKSLPQVQRGNPANPQRSAPPQTILPTAAQQAGR